MSLTLFIRLEPFKLLVSILRHCLYNEERAAKQIGAAVNILIPDKGVLVASLHPKRVSTRVGVVFGKLFAEHARRLVYRSVLSAFSPHFSLRFVRIEVVGTDGEWMKWVRREGYLLSQVSLCNCFTLLAICCMLSCFRSSG